MEKRISRKEKNWKKKVNVNQKYRGGAPLYKLYRYVLPKGYDFWAFLVRETGMVFEGTMGTYERIDILFQFQMNKKELEICEFEMHLKKYFYLA